jgi:hypothetical protein
MRGAGGFDDVLGRIRTARNSTYDADGGTPPKGRYDDLAKRPESTRPRGGEEVSYVIRAFLPRKLS